MRRRRSPSCWNSSRSATCANASPASSPPARAPALNLCKALLNDPELLLLDEPTASLDPDIADKVRKTIRRVQGERQISILYTSHNMRDIEEVCDRVIFLHKGKVVAEGTPAEIVARSQQNSLEDVFIKIARSGDIEEPPAPAPKAP